MFEVAIPVISLFVLAPAIVFGTIYKMKQLKTRVEELRLQKEIIELEVRRKELELYELQERDKHQLDRLIKDELRQIP
ncbi:MAG: hypothetical protein KKC64_13700 [Spirochaetes bacterium]|nr:hypothetical protein [Spirochaetota bacterium]